MVTSTVHHECEEQHTKDDHDHHHSIPNISPSITCNRGACNRGRVIGITRNGLYDGRFYYPCTLSYTKYRILELEFCRIIEF